MRERLDDVFDAPPARRHELDDSASPAAWRWQARMWALAVVFGLVAVTRSLQVGIGFKDPHGGVLLSRVGQSAGIFVLLILLDAAWQVHRSRSGATYWSGLRERWPARRLATAASILLSYHLIYFSYRNLKSWDVLNTPRDRDLFDFDRWLFGGHTPAVLLHDLFGQDVWAHVLMRIYASFPVVIAVAVVMPVALLPRLRAAAADVTGLSIVWILGTASYYLIPSLGPFHVAPDDFAGLPNLEAQRTQALYLAQRAHLLTHPHAADAWAQVSAFASLHVGMTTAVLLLARRHRLRITSTVLSIYLVGVMISTVYLGWHYVSDVVVGLLIGAAGLWLGARLIGQDPPPADSATP